MISHVELLERLTDCGFLRATLFEKGKTFWVTKKETFCGDVWAFLEKYEWLVLRKGEVYWKPS